MTLDPPRLSAPGSGASDSVRELLRASSMDGPSPDQLQRLAARLGEQLAPPPSPSSVPAATKTIGVVGKVLGVTAIVTILGALGYWLTRPDAAGPSPAQAVAPPVVEPVAPPPSPTEVSPATPAVPASVPPEPTAPSEPVVATKSATPVGSAPGRRSTSRVDASVAEPHIEVPPRETPSETRVESTEDELAILGKAQRALVANDAKAALSQAEHHAKTFPSGMMVEEREAIAIEALARLGRLDDARARFDRFRASYPRSSYRQRLERLITTTP